MIPKVHLSDEVSFLNNLLIEDAVSAVLSSLNKFFDIRR
jgi:hypothetical protein